LSSITRSENILFHVNETFGTLIILDRQCYYSVLDIEQAD
jgi:hypothetical protein